ncbi:hypothetical protein EDD16DRAFT_1489283 [Pisolithus croceorrhizus]|nr:hypothetical protein EDD16DRAFT_1489283 [Pisolithus croceorrhizus]KAI6167815.1 hypothetical protein EDD17DRAFT_1685936 [Pisolithus thermaeus]
MRLLDVVAVLDRERDIRTVDSEIGVLKELDDNNASHAILSHRHGTEVTYDGMTGLAAMKPQKRDGSMERDGYQKIIKSCEQAKRGGYRWLWIDTCCIDRRSDSELLETIDSMYQRYHNSGMCYVYLHGDRFSRGWTLQELTALTRAKFFHKEWMSIGIKEELTTTLEDITRIPARVLNDREVLKRCDTFPREDDANRRWSVFTAGLVRHERVDAVWRGLERFPVAPAGDHPVSNDHR